MGFKPGHCGHRPTCRRPHFPLSRHVAPPSRGHHIRVLPARRRTPVGPGPLISSASWCTPYQTHIPLPLPAGHRSAARAPSPLSFPAPFSLLSKSVQRLSSAPSPCILSVACDRRPAVMPESHRSAAATAFGELHPRPTSLRFWLPLTLPPPPRCRRKPLRPPPTNGCLPRRPNTAGHHRLHPLDEDPPFG
jgi:hypothetical protein